MGPGQSELAARTHRWEEFKKDCGKEDVAQTSPHDRTVGLEITGLTLAIAILSPNLLKSTMSTHFKSGPAFGLSAEVKSKVRSALIDSCQRCAGARALLESDSLLCRLFYIGGILGVLIFQGVLWEGYGDLI